MVNGSIIETETQGKITFDWLGCHPLVSAGLMAGPYGHIPKRNRKRKDSLLESEEQEGTRMENGDGGSQSIHLCHSVSTYYLNYNKF